MEERRGEEWRKTIEKWNWSGAWRARPLTQRDQCVWLPHEEEDDDINPLFLL